MEPPLTDGQSTIGAMRHAALAALGRRDLAAALAAVQRLDDLYGALAGPRAAQAAAHAELGDLWSLLAEYYAAYHSYTRSIRLAPAQARFWFNRAAVGCFLGELEAAEADYDRSIALAPGDAQAYLNRSQLRVQTPQRNHIAALEDTLAQSGGRWAREVPLRYALAKEYEDLGEYARSWQHLAAGAALRRGHLEYDSRRDLATVEWIRQAFPAVPPGTSGEPSTEPIFILGMPRTGSTLVDRILGSHPQVFSAGELPDFGAAVVAAVQQRRGVGVSRQELIASSARLGFAALGADYLRRTRPRTGHTPRFTDKLPLNYLYCGLIARALPQARIVHVTRGAMATCFGMYKVLFERGYPYSYDLAELADQYLGYRRLMAHWDEVLPGRVIEVRYESLVADTAGEAQRLCAALGLPWEGRCLAFERNPAPVATASAAQVRRPIYAGAVSVWRHYERELAPLAARLEAGGAALELSARGTNS